VNAPRFLADEDWRFEIVLAVRRLEPTLEIETVVELGRSGMKDGELLQFASENEWLVLSHDVNTMKAEAERRIADGRGIAGIFFAAQTTSTRKVAESVLTIWSASKCEEWVDRIVYLPI
jgi:hypothetical protein